MQNKDNKVSFADLSAEELQKKAVELQEREVNLQEKEKAFEKKDKDLDDLTKKNLDMAGKLVEKKENLDKREAAISKKETSPKSSKPEPGLELKFDGGDYQFTDEAPKKISIDGKGYTQEEIAADENLALALIGGNSGLILKK